MTAYYANCAVSDSDVDADTFTRRYQVLCGGDGSDGLYGGEIAPNGGNTVHNHDDDSGTDAGKFGPGDIAGARADRISGVTGDNRDGVGGEGSGIRGSSAATLGPTLFTIVSAVLVAAEN